MFTLLFESDNLIELQGPTDVTDDSGITGATVTAKLYDAEEDTQIAILVGELSADEDASQTVLSVKDTTGFINGDTVEVQLDDGDVHTTTINGAPTATEITLTAGIPSAASQHNEIRRTKHVTGSTSFTVDNGEIYEIGDAVEIEQEDGTLHSTTITQTQLKEITVADVSTDEVVWKGRVARLITASPITLSAYGTFPSTPDAIAGDATWGYRGTLTDTQAGLEIGQRVRIEINFNGGGGLQLLETIDAIVSKGS